MNEHKVDLPSGGMAWLTTIAEHRQAKVLKRLQLQLNHFLEPGRNEKGEPTTVWRTNLTREEQQQVDDLILDTETLNIATFTTRWENVRAPNGDALTFPDDIERMQEPDHEKLFGSIEEALLAGRADPNASKRPRRSTSRPGYSRKTPTSAST